MVRLTRLLRICSGLVPIIVSDRICLIGIHLSKFEKTLRINQMTGKMITVRVKGVEGVWTGV